MFGNNKNIIKKIEKAKNYYDYQVYEVQRQKHIQELLFEDYVEAVKSNLSRYDLIDLFGDAQKQIGEKLKKDRPQFEALKNFIMEDFLNNDKNFKLTQIVSCGYEGYGWNIVFEGYKKKFQIFIPVMRMINSGNIGYANNGMFAFIIAESEHCWSTLKASYDIKDVALFIKEYFNLEDKEEK